MKLRNIGLSLALLSTTPLFAFELPSLKGEWIQYDPKTDILSNKLVLLAGGKGSITDNYGVSDVTWKIEAGVVKISVEHPTMRLDPYFTPDVSTGDSYAAERGLESIELKFKKFEGFSIQWQTTVSELIHFTENPEKPDMHFTTVNENTRLVAQRQLKSFAPRVGEVVSLALPSYMNKDVPEDVHVLVRLDAANVLTRVDGFATETDQLFWTMDQGTLRVADGKGYSARFKVFEDASFFKHLYAEVERNGVQLAGDSSTVIVNRGTQALGFEAQSAIFKSCWTNMQFEYCFHKNREFIFAGDDNGTPYGGQGLWTLKDRKIEVQRYRYTAGGPVTELAEMLKCEEELRTPGAEPRCLVSQSRTYELLNQDERHLVVHRTMFFQDSDTHHYFHQFVKSRAL